MQGGDQALLHPLQAGLHDTLNSLLERVGGGGGMRLCPIWAGRCRSCEQGAPRMCQSVVGGCLVILRELAIVAADAVDDSGLAAVQWQVQL